MTFENRKFSEIIDRRNIKFHPKEFSILSQGPKSWKFVVKLYQKFECFCIEYTLLLLDIGQSYSTFKVPNACYSRHSSEILRALFANIRNLADDRLLSIIPQGEDITLNPLTRANQTFVSSINHVDNFCTFWPPFSLFTFLLNK